MYRLYIDETGNPDLEASRDPNHRYLSLTGVIIKQSHVRDVLVPRLEELKKEVFDPDPDEPLILHRKDIVQRNRPFHALREEAKAALFDARLISLLVECDYAVVTSIIDKKEHLERYTVWRHEPYHYCLEVLIERYFYWLNAKNAQGDVMAEVRGRKFDRQLERSFFRLYERGNQHISAQRFQSRLSSPKLKMKPKSQNIAGLQIADLLAHPSSQYIRSMMVGDVQPIGFGARISQLLVEHKYYRKHDGQIDGFGTKWLP